MTTTSAEEPARLEVVPPRLEVTNVSKRYGGVQAITSASLVVRPGTVHALIGENGAGKSTLIKIIAGAESPDGGVVSVDGESAQIRSTTDAMRLGIQTVYQEPHLFPELSVAENLFAGRELRRGARIDWRLTRARVTELLDMIGLPLGYASKLVRDLSIAEQQQIAIARILARDGKLLILDEPSAILTAREVERLFAIVRRMVAGGMSVIYVTHRLDELQEVADEVTVMRDGTTVRTDAVGNLSVRQMAELMVGGQVPTRQRTAPVRSAKPRLVVEGIASGSYFQDVSFEIAGGEVLGVYGLVGAGAHEIATSLYGLPAPDAGSITVEGKVLDPVNPRHARGAGIALLPADRKGQAMFGHQSVRFNVSIGRLREFARFGLVVDRRRERAASRDICSQLAVKAASDMVPVTALSGGNAQKVILARQLLGEGKVLVLIEPTQGVDIGAKAEIHEIVRQRTVSGQAVLLVSSDLDEVLELSDRIMVVRSGRVVAEFGTDATRVDLITCAVGDGVPEAG